MTVKNVYILLDIKLISLKASHSVMSGKSIPVFKDTLTDV